MSHWPRKRWLLLVYIALLGASHLIRPDSPDASPSEGQQILSVQEESTGAALRVAYWEWLPPEDSGREPVLLLHGSPGAGSVFRGLAPRTAATHRVLAPDLPGFGASTRRISDYSVASHGAMALDMLDSLGIRRVHVVGFSMGGGVALEMYRMAPERIRSLTLLSAIGVQEHELLGDYHLNHSIHGLQLFGIWAFTELVPHFGLLDTGFIGRSYARNFYDTDQRPLRGILEDFEPPMLILHGDQDDLVPPGAAEEHHRIVPQSQLAMLAGNHFMTFQRPGDLAPVLLEFLERVETGAALTRGSADPARIQAARVPFDPASRPPAYGFALVITLLLIGAATFVSEDLTCIGAGLLVARGSLPWFPAMVACLVGIWVGDLLLYAAGRFIGRPIVTTAPLKWFIREEDLDRSCRWFTKKSGALILWGRFVPGTRLPSYVAAGVVHLSFALFAFWALVAGVFWTPLLVGGTALFGTAAAGWIDAFQDRALYWLLATAFISLIALRVALPLATRGGRARWAARLGRMSRWEFWPPLVFYPPVFLYILGLAARYRSLTVFTAANPGIQAGGFVGESKSEILACVKDRRVAPFHLLPAGEPECRFAEAEAWVTQLGGYPVVVKPDVGERGAGVAIIEDSVALRRRLESGPGELVVQRYVPGAELGIFYYRIPGHPAGHILGITEKRLPKVVGDGISRIQDLILRDKRLRYQASMFMRRLATEAERIPQKGEEVVIGELGNHCLGSEFRDGSHLITPQLTEAVEAVSRSIDGFFFGRYDVRGENHAAIVEGAFEIIELNGVTSEATHVYDPDNSLITVYRTLFRQWSLAFQIGDRNRKEGARPVSLRVLIGDLIHHFRPGGQRWVGL